MGNDEKKQVTITFGGYDNSNDNTLMFEGPLHVAAVLNSVDDVYTFNVTPYADSDLPLVVFVRNVNDPDRVVSGEIPYRGSFFMYNWDTSAWQQVVLGNHSHKNMAILDQLGEVDTSSMEIGERKILTIEKIDPDNEGNIRTYDYKISFDTIRELPEVPEYGNGKNLYLTTDAEGKFQWANSFAPAQTFKILKITVDSTFITGNASKVLKLSSDYLIKNTASYNPDMGDEMLVFDTGDLLSDVSIEKLSNNDITITITNAKPADIFELDEKIVILIIRSGIAGLIETVKEQYITKAEAIDLLSYGTINLNQYITKYDLQRYAAQLEHTHSQYLRKDEFDVFDYRYADYQHTHSQYITKAQVLSILLDSVTDTGDIDVDGVVRELVEELENQLNSKLDDIYTREQIDTLIEAQISTVKNTDAIITTINNMTLTDYLMYLNTKEPVINSLESEKVKLDLVKVNIGDAPGIGGYKNGDIIEKGTTLNDFIKTLVVKDVPPELRMPELQPEVNVLSNDAGSQTVLNLAVNYVQHDGGNLSELSYKIYRADDELETTEAVVINAGQYVSIPVVMNALDNTGLCYKLRITASYLAGQERFSNANSRKAYRIPAGTLETEIPIYNTRMIYIGALTREISEDDPLLSDDLYTAIYGTASSLFRKYDTGVLYDPNGITLKLNPNLGIKALVIAIPENQFSRLSAVNFLNQNFNLFSDMEIVHLKLKDAAGNKVNGINNNYGIAYFNFDDDIKSGLTFNIKFN